MRRPAFTNPSGPCAAGRRRLLWRCPAVPRLRQGCRNCWPSSLNRLPGMRYRTRHLTIAATVPLGQRRAEGRDSGSLGSLAPGAPGRGHGTGGHRVRSPRHGQFGPPPRHRRPAARDQPRLGRGLTRCPVRLGQSGAVSCPTVPSPYEPVRRQTPLGDQVAWDLTGRLGIPKLSVWPGGSGWTASPCTSP